MLTNVILCAGLSLITQKSPEPDALRLPIGTPGEVTVQAGWTKTQTGKPSSATEIATAIGNRRFVLVGETHDSLAHHLAQAEIIEAIAQTGRPVVVGMEMFTRDNQRNIAPWGRGYWSDQEFIDQSDWKKQWGVPYPLYKPIFDVIKERRIPLVALNVPRAWVSQVGKKGPAALNAEQKKWVPSVDTTNQNHRQIFNALIGGHPMAGAAAENMYAAQVVWDTGMAKTALDEMTSRPGAVIVILAGSGHVIYGQGIAYRLRQMGASDSLILTGIDADGPVQVSKGIADYIFAAPSPTR